MRRRQSRECVCVCFLLSLLGLLLRRSPGAALTTVVRASTAESSLPPAPAGPTAAAPAAAAAGGGAQPEAKLADGCRHVYVDLGSNRGVQLRKLFEGALYPNSVVEPLFTRWFGPPDVRSRAPDLCAFGFEPNEVFRQRLSKIEEVIDPRDLP